MQQKDKNHNSLFEGMGKGRLFLFIILVIIIAGSFGSLMAYFGFLSKSAEEKLNIAVIAPFSGPESKIGESLKKGAEVYIEQINDKGGINGKIIGIKTIDEYKNRGKLKSIIRDIGSGSKLIGVIGHKYSESLSEVSEEYKNSRLPLIVPLPQVDTEKINNEYIFFTDVNKLKQASFLANYLRNVMGEKIVSVIYEDTPNGQALFQSFDKSLRSFGRKVVYKWKFEKHGKDLNKRFDNITETIDEKKIPGTILILGESSDSAKALSALRRKNLNNKVAGISSMTTNSFLYSVYKNTDRSLGVSGVSDNLITTTPFLFDTAGEQAQRFKTNFKTIHSSSPDWVASSGYDSVKILLKAFKSSLGKDSTGIKRDKIQQSLLSLNSRENSVLTNSGAVSFDNRGIYESPVLMGKYNGATIVSTLTQLQPIRDKGVKDYLNKLKEGRLLYANNSFMYKTNVVYTGVQLLEVSKPDFSTMTSELDFLIWFRYRVGKFSPEDISFTNSKKEILLEKPEKEIRQNNMTYSLYRVSGNFFMNYKKVNRPYGNHFVGISYRHNDLTKNNLMYVTDVLGMNLADKTFNPEDYKSESSEGKKSFQSDILPEEILKFFKTTKASSGGLKETLGNNNVMAEAKGWLIDRAWISQDIILEGSRGEPDFLGYGKPSPEFSKVNFGMILKPEKLRLREFIPSDYFIYLSIFAFVGIIAAELMDRKERGQFWRFQTLILRAFFWLILLASLGNLVLDYSIQNFNTSTVDIVVTIYKILWWIIPAFLVSLSVDRFLWTPLEVKAKRTVPNIIRKVVSISIYLFAICGVIAFVFDKQLTSLLASTGVLAMIIGLAIQANLANIFSGIILNVERPFDIGDAVTIGGESGVVKDVTWRTVRLEDFKGHMISIPNDTSSHSNIYNYTRSEGLRADEELYLSPEYDPGKITKILSEIINKARDEKPDLLAEKAPEVYLAGNMNIYGDWVYKYGLRLWKNKDASPKKAIDYVWQSVFKELQKQGIKTDLKKGVSGDSDESSKRVDKDDRNSLDDMTTLFDT